MRRTYGGACADRGGRPPALPRTGQRAAGHRGGSGGQPAGRRPGGRPGHRDRRAEDGSRPLPDRGGRRAQHGTGRLRIPMRGPGNLHEVVTALFRAPLWDLVGDHRYGLYAVSHPDGGGTFLPGRCRSPAGGWPRSPRGRWASAVAVRCWPGRTASRPVRGTLAPTRDPRCARRSGQSAPVHPAMVPSRPPIRSGGPADDQARYRASLSPVLRQRGRRHRGAHRPARPGRASARRR
jgi:hypothetical protein